MKSIYEKIYKEIGEQEYALMLLNTKEVMNDFNCFEKYIVNNAVDNIKWKIHKKK